LFLFKKTKITWVFLNLDLNEQTEKYDEHVLQHAVSAIIKLTH